MSARSYALSILAVARAAGLQLAGPGPKFPISCPFHADDNPSAFLDEETGCFYCSVCTPEHGWGVRRFAEALGVVLEHGDEPVAGRSSATPSSRIAFGAAEASEVWDVALDRARDDDAVADDRAAYDYLGRRGLIASWESNAFGVLATGMRLPAAVAGWPATGHVVVAPLVDGAGQVANVQARAIRPASKKTLFPIGSRAKGMLFASHTGLAVLRGQWTGSRCLVLGEGLTDFLAFTITCPVPVLSAPGTGLAAHGIGPWIAGFDVLLALDDDAAGAKARMPTAQAAYRHGARSVRRVVWPGHAKDACNVIEQRGSAALADFLAHELEVLTRG